MKTYSHSANLCAAWLCGWVMLMSSAASAADTDYKEPDPPDPAAAPASQQREVLINFAPEQKLRAKGNRYKLAIAGLGSTSPTVSTTDPGKSVPAGSGTLGALKGSVVLTLDGRRDDTSTWLGDTWSGGSSSPLNGSADWGRSG